MDIFREEEGFQTSHGWSLFFPIRLRNILPASEPSFAALVPPSSYMAAISKTVTRKRHKSDPEHDAPCQPHTLRFGNYQIGAVLHKQ